MPTWSDALRLVLASKVTDMTNELTKSNEEATIAAYTMAAKRKGVSDDVIKATIKENVVKWAEVTKNSVVKTMQSEIENMLQEGFDNQTSTQELSRQLDDLVDGRGEIIARTEVSKAINTGKFMAYKDNGTRFKQWVHGFRGPLARDSHEELDDLGPIPMDEPYETDLGPIMYPGDPDADVGDLCNCHCSISEANEPEGYEDDE